jgi:hypothetical protein
VRHPRGYAANASILFAHPHFNDIFHFYCQFAALFSHARVTSAATAATQRPRRAR